MGDNHGAIGSRDALRALVRVGKLRSPSFQSYGTALSHPEVPWGQDTAAIDVAAARLGKRVFQQWWLILLCALVGAVGAFAVSQSRTKQYEATSTIEVGTIDLMSIFLAQDVQISDSDPDRATAAAVELFNLPNVRDRAVRALRERGSDIEAPEINGAIRVTAKPDTSVITIVARSSSPLRAQQISNAMTTAFIEQRQATARKKLVTAKTQVRAQYENLSEDEKFGAAGQALKQRLDQVGVVGALSDGNVTVIQGARLPTNQVAPKPRRDAFIGLIGGFLLGCGIALLRARLDDRIRETDELSEIWNLPVVGLVPQTGTLKESGRKVPEPAALEALSLARTNLRYLHVGGRVKTVVVTSALEGEGKSTVTWNLAIAAALASSKVLVIEGDLRRPVISSRLNLAGSGFSEVLAGLAELDETIQAVTVADDLTPDATKVDVLPAGLVPPSPVALLEGDATKTTFAELRERYDIILIDTPPATVVADAVAISDEVDGVLIVSRLGKVRRGALKRLREILTAVDAPVIGQIVNGDAAARNYGYYSSYTKRAKGYVRRPAATRN